MNKDAIYIKIKQDKVHHTIGVCESGEVIIDFNDNNEVVGIELIGPAARQFKLKEKIGIAYKATDKETPFCSDYVCDYCISTDCGECCSESLSGFKGCVIEGKPK